MQYRSSTRLLAAVAAALAVTAGTALTAVPAAAAPVTAVRAPAQAAAVVTLPHPTEIVSAGATGYLTRAVYPSGTEYRWTNYADGATKYLTKPRTTFMGAQSDIVFSREDTKVTYWLNDMTSNDPMRYGLSHNDQRYMLDGIAGETLVMSYTDEDTGKLDVDLLSRASGTQTTTDVPAVPDNARMGRVWAGTPGIALIQYSTGTGADLRTFLVPVDTATGRAVDGPRQTHSERTGADAFVSRTHWAWIERTTSNRVQLVTALRGIDAPEVTTDLGQASTGADIDVNLVGNWVTTAELNGHTAPVASALFPLTARSLADPRRTIKLLDHVSSSATAPNGDLYARGGTVAQGEGIYHIFPGDNGEPVATLVAGTDAPTALALTSTEVPSTVDLDKNGGKATLQWQLSRENAAGKVTLRHVRTGRTVEFPFENQGGVRREWQGTLTDGVLAPNGDYTWQLDAKPLNGIGPALKKTGTFKVTRKAGLHDYDDNGAPDLLSRDASGRLWRDEVRKTSSSTDYWSLESKLVGAGWNGYNQIEAVGNVAGAPAPDMVARDASGVLWLYLGKGDGTFADRTRIGAGWNGYNKITGGSDLNGDGWSDLLATDASGVLWAYQGTGNWSSPYLGRTKVGGGWGAMNQITAVGDIAGTPQGDLLARDTSGVLWLYQGATGSSFATRVRVGPGWGAYTHLVGMGDVDRDGRNDLFAYGTGGSFVYRGTGSAAAPFGPRESSSVYPATPTPRHPIV
ncbi:VCBS repeat-containing protein [Streptomyces sp. TX20-6-3]|uniref:VCBS repeat-containing protein n=1 Tax=Streptomyces sp. TX20-6-3 TaxID=3028705 RepID=UPI00299FEA5B|nr:VCBS repeat-containing protein [Streptomyces sp. TX20-6-3]MDX2560066.1 VCBS repeat-containing protein [Streptomyces sp. TX20-6-3]